MAKSDSKAAPSVCNLLLPVTIEYLIGLAEKMVSGESLTVSEVNGGRFSVGEIEEMWGVWDEETETFPEGSMNHGLYEGFPPDKIPFVPAIHQPTLLIGAKSLKMTFAGNGQPKSNSERPDNWPSHLPTWKSGFSISDAFGRAQALKDVRRNVGSGHLLQIDEHEYVVGNGRRSAVEVFHGSKGNSSYAFNVACAKNLAFRGRPEINGVVFQINNSVEEVPWTGDRTEGTPLVMLPNMVATAGRFVRGGKNLTDEQIAIVVENGEVKGITFKPLSRPIVGNSVSRTALLAAVKKAMNAKATHDEDGHSAWYYFLESYSGDVEAAENAIWVNVKVQTRNNPIVTYCFGLRNSVLHQPLAIVYGDSCSDKRITCIVGQRCGDALTAKSREEREETAVKSEIKKVKKVKAEVKAEVKAKDKAEDKKVKAEDKKVAPVAPVDKKVEADQVEVVEVDQAAAIIEAVEPNIDGDDSVLENVSTDVDVLEASGVE